MDIYYVILSTLKISNILQNIDLVFQRLTLQNPTLKHTLILFASLDGKGGENFK